MRLRKTAGAFTIACGLLFFFSSAVAAPQRVVSTNVCGDEYAFRLLPRAHIAALSFEAGDRAPVVSTIADKVAGIPQIHPSVETVLKFKPDLVIMQTGTLPRLRLALDRLGVPVLELPYDNALADVRRTARMMGDKLGARAAAEALLRTMDARLVVARARAVHPPIRTLIFEPNGYATSGGLTDELMTLAGLTDVSAGFAVTRSGRIPVEEVVARAPELMILSSERHRPTAQADLVLHHPALAALQGRTTAVWERFVPLLCAGPWTAEAAVRFAELGRQARLAPKQARN